MGAKIHTILGAINPENAGITLMHEHMLLDAVPGWWKEPVTSQERKMAMLPVTMEVLGYLHHNPLGIKSNLALDEPEIACEEVKRFKEAGGGTIVELSITGLGENRIHHLVDISKRTGVNIVAGSGFYLDNSIPASFRDWSVDQMASYIVKEIEEGIEGSPYKAGIIGEVGTSYPITAFEERSLKAGAKAQKETGACISVHISPDGKEGLRALKILEGAGADLTRVIMDHMDEHLDLDYHRAIAATGAMLEYDTFGAEWYYATVDIAEPRDTDRIQGLIQLIAGGYINQLIISHDVWLKQCWVHYGGLGYAHILEHVVPMLKKRGVTTEQVDQILIRNPQRLLAF